MTKRLFLIISLVFLVLSGTSLSQTLGLEKDRHKQILKMIRDDVKKNYLDPTLKGRNIEADYKNAVEKLEKATSIGQMSGIIAQFLVDFDDSHLFFVPPSKANKTDYGFDFRMVGEKCFILSVDKDSDAQKKGMQVGDEVFAINDYGPNRENLWKMRYYYFSLRPQPFMKVDLIKPDGKQVQLSIEPRIRTGKRVKDLTGADINEFIRENEDAYREETKQYYYDTNEGVFIWKMPSFSLDPDKVDNIMGKARKYPAIIFDLRGNGGGRVDMVMRLIGNVFDREIKVADEKRRKETKELIAKTRGKDAFAGKIVILMDSSSASASEIFSRVLQIEKRGTVFGDQSAGAVMESRFYANKLGMDVVIFFGASITVADLIMKDGKSLEKTGVTPDVKMLPGAIDLAKKRDVVMSKALESLGITMTPEVAGAMFPESEDNK